MDARQERGMKIASESRIDQKHGFYLVPSQSGKGARYWVKPDPASPTCTCPDFEERGQRCKHIFAVECIMQRETDGSTGETTITRTVKVTERVTYRQDWPAYNKAQTNEKARFQALLHDLCQGIADPPRPEAKPGRKPVRMADIVFAAVFKVYGTVSGRRSQTDLREAEAKGHISRAYHYNTVAKHMEMEGLSPLLCDLITLSSFPLKAIESDFAVDSSGFTTSRFIRWFDQKYGGIKEEHEWVKVHLMCGVKTNVVTAVIIDDKRAADCPQMPALVRTTAKHFTIREVSADKAYASGPNFQAVADCGGTAYIPFKSNATGASGGLYEKMFHLYSLNRDDYLAHYHKRSNVESTFSMIKAKFGDHIRSKTDAAMVNEALCKVLCHNICCLIQSQYELGVEAMFWTTGQIPPDALGAEPSLVEDADFWAWV